MATVYQCTDTRLNVTVAVKLLHKQHRRNPEVVRRFLREAHLQARLRHPNIVAVSNVEDRDSITFLVMEFLKGINLADYYRAKKRLDEAEALEYIIPIADALGLAHDQDIVHRDLKPGNIFLAEQGGRLVPKLMDFGVARQLDASITTTSTLLGTLPYMSLELVQSARNASPASDVYALGVTLFEILTGRLPILSSNFQEYVFQLLDLQEMPRIKSVRSDLSDTLDGIIDKCLAKEATNRFTTARPVAEALSEYQKALGPRRATVRAASPARAAAPPPGANARSLIEQRGYTILESLGRGPVAELFHCRTQSGDQVDIKAIHQDLGAHRGNRQHFLKCSQKQAALARSSYYIQPILEVIDSIPATVVKHPIGSTVESLLNQYGSFELAYALDLFIYLTDAIHAAHQANLLHGHIYPGNILLAQQPDGVYTPLIQDFGHLRIVDGTHRAALKDQPPVYLAPELIESLSNTTAASDIFSFGVSLYRALSGKAPADLEGFDAYEAYINDNRSFPDIRTHQPEIPETLAQVLGWCIAFGSGQRYQDFQQLKRDLLTVRQMACGY